MFTDKRYYSNFIIFTILLMSCGLSNASLANESGNAINDSLLNRYLNSNNDSIHINVLVKLAANMESNNTLIYKSKSADDYLQLANFKAIDSVSIHNLASQLDNIAFEYRKNGYYTFALKFHNWAKDVSERIDDKNLQSIIYNNIGVVYRRLDDYQTALTNHIYALKLAEEINNFKSQAVAINSIGNIQMMIGNYDESLEYFKQSLIIEQKQNSLLGIAINLNNIGNVYSMQNDYKKSLEYFFLSLDINREINSNRGIAICYNDIGNVYELKGEFDKALSFFLDALNINLGLNDKHNLANSYLQIGELYTDFKKYDKALEYLLPGLEISIEIGTKAFIMDSYNALYVISRAQKKYEEAINYLQLFNQYHDSIININVRKDIARLRVKFESERNESQIVLLKQEAEISRLEINRHKTISWLILIAFIIAVGFVISLSYYLYNKNKTNKLLLERNKIIEQTKAELDDYSKQLLKAKQEADQNNHAKGEFLANMSHEIRTPLNSIIGFAELIMKSSLNSNDKNHLKIIKSSGQILLTITNDILDLSKIEAGKFTIDYENVSLEQVFDDVTQMFSQRIHEKNIKIITNIHKELPQIIFFSELRLQQILFNIIGNAVKFTNEGSIIINAYAELTNTNDEINFHIDIADTGVGIQQHELYSIFEPFCQAEINKTNSGTGLGLAITKRLVEMMDGSISVDSTLGKGSKFSISFFNVKVVNTAFEIEDSLDANIVNAPIEAKNIIVDIEKLNIYFYDLPDIESINRLEKDIIEIYNMYFKIAFDTKLISRIDQFVSALNDVANKYKSEGLVNYCAKLNYSIQNFEIDEIDKLLNMFNENYQLK